MDEIIFASSLKLLSSVKIYVKFVVHFQYGSSVMMLIK